MAIAKKKKGYPSLTTKTVKGTGYFGVHKPLGGGKYK
jgi:hypothetical protein